MGHVDYSKIAPEELAKLDKGNRPIGDASDIEDPTKDFDPTDRKTLNGGK